MSARIQRFGLMSAIALSALAVYACGDDDDDDDNNNVGDGDGDTPMDSGTPPVDSGTPPADSAAPVVTCGEPPVTCEDVVVFPPSTGLGGCCVESSATCGLDTTLVSTATGGDFPAGCLERNQPTVPAEKKNSVSCTALWETLDDSVETTPPATPNGFTFSIAGMSVNFGGCCRMEGERAECGFLADTVFGAPVNFGCLPLSTFEQALGDNYEAVKAAAGCDATTGEIPQPDAGP